MRGDSLGFTWTHLDSFGFTWTHLDSPGLTWIHLDSLGFTWTHLDSLGFTWTHLDSFGFTWTHLDSLGFTWIHLDALGFTSIYVREKGKPCALKGKRESDAADFLPRSDYATRPRVRTHERNETISRFRGGLPKGELIPPTSDDTRLFDVYCTASGLPSIASIVIITMRLFYIL